MAHPPTDTDTTTPTPAVEQVDPSTLLVDLNIRQDTHADPDLVASIRDLGVLVPIVAVRTPTDDLRVRFGHRRTLAAIQAGRPTVPVVVMAEEGSDDTAEIERLIGQWAENEQRSGLDTTDRIAAIAQLSAFGLSPTKIAKRTRVTRTDVDAALTIAGSELAKVATARYDFLDLIQAAAIAEFEDDPEAVKALVAAAKTGQFDHTLQRLRDARAENQRRADLEDRLRQEGTLLVENPTWQNTTKYLDDLRTDDGREALTIEGHQDCPGHAACLATQWGYLDPVTGALIDEDAETDEDDSEEQDTARPQWTSLLTIRYVCTDPLQYGHHSRYPDAHTPAARTKLADMSEDEQQAARAQRRDVIESNRAWTSAERVRRTWLRTFVARKTPPKGSAAFLAEAVAADADLLARIGGNQLAANILGCEKKGFGRNTQMATLAAQASEQRAQVIVLAQVLAAYEDATIRDHWRHRAEHTTRYLLFLQTQGYALSNVERRACGLDPVSDPIEQ